MSTTQLFLSFLITETYSNQFGVWPFTKIFGYFCMVTNCKFRITLIIFLLKCQHVYLTLYQNAAFWLCYDKYCCVYKLYCLFYQHTHFLILNSPIYKFYLLSFLDLTAAAVFHSLSVDYILVSFSCNHDFINIF